jgi:transcriptional regulator with XRE-family HTH domain
MDDSIPHKTDAKVTGRRYPTVDQLLRGENIPNEVSLGVRKLALETRFTRMLAALRVKSGLTQDQMGEKMDPVRSQSAISKLESGRDEELTIGDIRDYAKALNERIGLTFGPPMNHVEAIKAFALAMRERMLALAKLAHEDGQMETEIQAFFGEAFFNILTILATCQQQMPNTNKNDFEFKIELMSCTTNQPKAITADSNPPVLV